REAVENNPSLVSIGKVYGFTGVLRLSVAAEPRLIFIRTRDLVCKIKEHEIYKITSVISVPLETEFEVEVESVTKAKQEEAQTTSTNAGVTSVSAVYSCGTQGVAEVIATPTAWNKIKIPSCPNSKKYFGRNDKMERRLLDEFHKMFVEADSFYYSTGYNIFSSLQQQTSSNASEQQAGKTTTQLKSTELEQNDKNQNKTLITVINLDEPIWKQADERFLWNQYMLSDITSSQDFQLHKWAIAILQGSIQHQKCQLDPTSARVTQNDSEEPADLELILISRRSRYRAGTRYLKRGVDENGKVANYVETEQIMAFRGHLISFLQTRGSVPIFWSQPGYKYRPPIRLDKSIEESLPAFESHINEEIGIYGALSLINLVEKNGRERALEEARGLKFDNVKLLTERLSDITRNMAYCWVDSYGIVMKQNGTYRVNCVDCLDRTNVVQSFLAKDVLSHQLSKVGLLMPEIGLSDAIKKKFLEMWANNGDIISKQYAGTNALKGDFTRTGERKFAGVMRDGMNSANRYLNNRLRDGTRQACIDLVLGLRSSVTEEELTLGKEAVEDKEITTELVMQMIEDVKHCIVPHQSVVLGSWGLVNAKTNDIATVDVDTVLVLTESDCYVALYDLNLDSIAGSTKVSLSSITSLEICSEPISHSHVSSVWGFFQASGNSNAQASIPSLKMQFTADDDTKDSFQFRSSNIRCFNNCVTHITHPDEMMEALKMLAETIKAAVFSHDSRIIMVNQAVTPGKSSQRAIPGLNAWIPRWNTANPASHQDSSAEPTGKKFSPASMQRFAPNFLKKKRNNVQVEDEDGAIKMKALDQPISPLHSGVPQALNIPTTLLTSSNESSILPTVIRPHAVTPEEAGSTVHIELLDLYLPSCGILCLHGKPPSLLQTAILPDILGENFKYSPGVSPITPIMDMPSQDITPTSTDTNASMKLPIPQDLLNRHRFSLPTTSLTITTTIATKGGRSTTPEIRITEEPVQGSVVFIGSTCPTTTQKRMSRSSEDVNKVTSITAGVKMFNNTFINKVPVTLKNKLTPNLQQEGRSTSDQDIFSTLVNMKGSHSENAIKDPVQKRDVMFAPLGKLARGMQNIGANYLDPRKIRDSLRQPRQDIVVPDDPEILEKMKTCKSQIIDI
ncbi:Phosphatidylinositide phosphatase SAC2, partial [Orchesella cincta]